MVDQTVAIITPSYAADFERCRLLCDSIDACTTGIKDHYILVDHEDYPLFSQLASKHRHVIDERDILPDWLRVIRGGISRSARKLWVSTKAWPMRGWHVQQLRRIAIARHVEHTALLYCDSDMLFVRPFDASLLWKDEKLRLYRKPDGITANLVEHIKWREVAVGLIGLPELSGQKPPFDDYVNNLVSWRRENILAMCNRIENHTARDWVSAIARHRTFSECIIYGNFIDGVLNEDSGHWHASNALCLTYWGGEALKIQSLQQFVEKLNEQQYAIGIQSFTNTDTGLLRSLFEKAA